MSSNDLEAQLMFQSEANYIVGKVKKFHSSISNHSGYRYKKKPGGGSYVYVLENLWFDTLHVKICQVDPKIIAGSQQHAGQGTLIAILGCKIHFWC